MEVCEFARELGGSDAVPTDGTVVALGLGKLLRRAQVPLESGRPSGRTIDEIRWMTTHQRREALRSWMGRARYTRAAARHQEQLKRISLCRLNSREDEKDVHPMPSSLLEAREIAQQFAEEAAAAVRDAALSGPGASTPPKVKPASRKRRAAGEPEGRRRPRGSGSLCTSAVAAKV